MQAAIILVASSTFIVTGVSRAIIQKMDIMGKLLS
jgi:hypothetical protein